MWFLFFSYLYCTYSVLVGSKVSKVTPPPFSALLLTIKREQTNEKEATVGGDDKRSQRESDKPGVAGSFVIFRLNTPAHF